MRKRQKVKGEACGVDFEKTAESERRQREKEGKESPRATRVENDKKGMANNTSGKTEKQYEKRYGEQHGLAKTEK